MILSFVALPEVLLLALSLTVLLIDLIFSKRIVVVTALSGVLLLTLLIVYFYPTVSVIDFSGHFVADKLSQSLKIVTLILTTMVGIYSYQYWQLKAIQKGEFFVILLLAQLGMMVMVSAGSLITAYLGLELMSLSLYGLVAWDRKDSLGTEAAVKYFILGSVSSGFLLFGMSFVYGATGSLLLQEISHLTNADNFSLLLFGLVFIVVGVGFKLGTVPFHMWLPDIYHGAPTVVTSFIASAPKVAVFGLLFRLWIEGLSASSEQFQDMLMILAIASLILGNFVAIAQRQLKRMLAYSAIAHMGFMLLGVLTISPTGYAAAMYYVIIYALMGVAIFGILSLIKRADNEIKYLDDLKGLSKQNPIIAAMILVIMLSLIGIPPLAGFYAKLVVLRSLLDVELFGLAILAVIVSVIGSFYYLRVIWYMYFLPEEVTAPIEFKSLSMLCCTCISLNVFLLIALGILPSGLIDWCFSAISQTLL